MVFAAQVPFLAASTIKVGLPSGNLDGSPSQSFTPAPAPVQVPFSAAASIYLTESPVTLAVTLSTTSTPTETGPDADGLVVRETRIENKRLLTEADVLAEMVARNLIPTAEGHVLVAVWAAWSDADPFRGSSFRFFVRKPGLGRHALVKVPAAVLALTPQDWLQSRDLVLLRKGNVSGTARYESYSQLKVSVGGRSASLLGRDTGGGLYRSPSRFFRTQYLPAAAELTMSGSTQGGFVEARLGLGPARFVRRDAFAPGALPVNTGSGGWFGSFEGMASTLRIAGISVWDISRPNPIEYFCPLQATLVLRRQIGGAASAGAVDRAQITSATLTEADLLAEALAGRGITDATGWKLFLHDYGDEYESLADLRLIAAHPDGRVLELSVTPRLVPDAAGAEESRRSYLNNVLQTAHTRRIGHLSHDRDWQVPGGVLSLLLNGRTEVETSFGPVPGLDGVRYERPEAATFNLYGSYELGVENGLAEVVFTLSPPLPQAEIPAAWLNQINRDKAIIHWTPWGLVTRPDFLFDGAKTF